MNQELLNYLKKKPEVYAPGAAKFWDDEHISKGMLQAHLDPEWDAATRKHDFILKSADWISSIANPVQYPKLLDLGCGPGLYAERFYKKGYQVTGVDYSKRSIEYAKDSALKNKSDITYVYKNYLDITYQEEFDIITIIYCDFGVFSPNIRKELLNKIYRALKPGGIFLFDAFTPKEYENRPETAGWSYFENGFWSEKPYACLDSFRRYDECTTYLDQAVIITEMKTECYNIWNHAFTVEEAERELLKAGFASVDFYGDVAGSRYTGGNNTLCSVAKK